MKKNGMIHIILLLTMLSISTICLHAQPHLHIERNFEALRLDGNQSWLSFYDGSIYEGYIFNNNGNLTLGTTEFNPNGQIKFVTNLTERMTISDFGEISMGSTGLVLGNSLSVNAFTHGSRAIRTNAIGKQTRGLQSDCQGEECVSIYATATGLNSYGLFSESAYIGVFGKSTNDVGVVGRSDNANSWDFFASGAGINYGAASSRRWKNKIITIDTPLDKIAALRGVYFDWDEEHGGKHDIGFIAEEVGEVLPEIVAYEENGIDAKGLDYSKITPLLVEAFKALQKEYQETIFQLKNRIEQLEKQMHPQVDSSKIEESTKTPSY